ncbi:discoidin domain-containing protein [Cohnella luojiensis]|uniref:Coagulation factor 5/8 type domain-containing protein n=1 Tax=Cohnella luojiensis TaxID=652876 RepID=A0A4Y8M3J4_9BACL|nr:discoidin domain-containing protein [Cohnella luojiensis]TFE28610.1 coagulation factor 5/8 type domain-containing protein [Cohnella luojiensis]
MRKKGVKVYLLLSLLLSVLLPFGAGRSFAAAVTISQTGNVVTASNGVIKVNYDLSTGTGNFKEGSTTLIANFNSDYALNGTSTRYRSSDPATRSASWTTIGTDGYGTNGKMLTITNSLASGSTIVLRIAMYENQSYIIADMTVSNGTSQTINFLEPIAANNLDIGSGSDKRIYTSPYTNNYDFGVAPVNDFGNSQNGYDKPFGVSDTWSAFNGTSYWVASVFDNANKHGIVAGAATTQTWKSMQYLQQASSANGPLTGFSVYNAGGKKSGTSVSSDKFFLGYFTDYRIGLETFGNAYTVGEPKLAWNGEVPIGYNTYYSFYAKPTADAMYPMTDYFEDNLKSLGYNYMNLDCCYQGVAGQTPVQNLNDYVDYVHSKGMKAGAYSAPFAIWDPLTDTVPGTAYTFGDIALKDAGGNRIKSYLDTYIVDATHPGGQAYLEWVMQTYHVNPGFDYVKLDFIDFGMFEGSFYDSTKNGMQAYRIGMQVMRDTLLAAPQDIYINESIAPLLPSGYAHGRRSGVDTTIGLESYPGIERQSLNAAASWWTNGTLYEYNDVDMALPENMIAGFNKMTLNEHTLLSTAIILGGGHWLVGDNVPFISEDRMSILFNEDLMDLVKSGQAAKPVSMTNFYHKLEHSPTAVYLTDTNGDKVVGLSNWDMNNSSSATVSFADLGLSPSTSYTLTELYSQTKLGAYTGSYSRTLKPGESIIVRVSTNSSSLPNPPTNLAAGKTAIASSTWSGWAGHEASKVTDGSQSTRWSAENGTSNNQWIEVDFGSAANVNQVVVYEYNYGNQNFQVETYALQYWNGSSYVNLTKGYTLGDRRVFNFPTVSTSKIRLNIPKARFIPSINEIEAYHITGITGYIVDQDDSESAYSVYSDIRAQVQRMQTFTLTQPSLPKMDVYLYESYVNKEPEDNLYLDIVLLDASNFPTQKLFSAALHPSNVPGSATPYSIYPRLTGLDTTKKYGLIFRSPLTVDDSSTNNKYGFGYSDSNPYAGGFERLSTNGGTSWSTESSGNRDLIFTIYK